MKIFLYIFAMLIVSSCSMQQHPVSSEKPGNNQDYTVKYLFEYGGCKVYRFLDGGLTVYYTNCNGEAIAKTDSTTLSTLIKAPRHQ